MDVQAFMGGEIAGAALEGVATSATGSLFENAPVAVAGGLASLGIGLLSVPIAGALAASYAPRSPGKGALIALGVSIGLGILSTVVAAGSVAAALGGDE